MGIALEWGVARASGHARSTRCAQSKSNRRWADDDIIPSQQEVSVRKKPTLEIEVLEQRIAPEATGNPGNNNPPKNNTNNPGNEGTGGQVSTGP
jgi:hypothetical protein